MNSLLGHNEINLFLSNMIEKKKIGNALLFSGPEGIGKSLYARAFAKRLICGDTPSQILLDRFDHGNHPDLHILKPEGKMCVHSMDSLRALTQEVAMPPYEAPHKVFILEDAHCMLPTSANALLKTFEEPSDETVIILVTHKPQALLQTILSRCRVLRFSPLEKKEIEKILLGKGVEADKASTLATLSRGSVSYALRLATHDTDPKLQELYTLFKKERFHSYAELINCAHNIANLIEKDLKEKEKNFEDFSQVGVELNAFQKEALEKERQGALSALRFEAFQELINEISYWFRDNYMVKQGGDPAYLLHPELKENYYNSKRTFPTLESVQQTLQEASISLQRATKVQNCLEFVFLSLFL